MQKIIFVRHGKDDDRYRGGWSNMDLIPEGMEQAKRLAKHLAEKKSKYDISHIVSSDLPRAMTTASFVSTELILPIVKESRIRETNNGELAGMLNDEALIRYPGLFFSSLKMDEPYPNGESPNDFYMRIKAWFDEFIIEHQLCNGNVLVVIFTSNRTCLIHIPICQYFRQTIINMLAEPFAEYNQLVTFFLNNGESSAIITTIGSINVTNAIVYHLFHSHWDSCNLSKLNR